MDTRTVLTNERGFPSAIRISSVGILLGLAFLLSSCVARLPSYLHIQNQTDTPYVIVVDMRNADAAAPLGAPSVVALDSPPQSRRSFTLSSRDPYGYYLRQTLTASESVWTLRDVDGNEKTIRFAPFHTWKGSLQSVRSGKAGAEIIISGGQVIPYMTHRRLDQAIPRYLDVPLDE